MTIEDIKLPEPIKGYKLMKAVESVMDKLAHFDIRKKRNFKYNSKTETMEINQLLEARRRFKCADLREPFQSYCSWVFLMPVVGPLCYLLELSGYSYAIQTEKIELNSIYNRLKFAVVKSNGEQISTGNIFWNDIDETLKQITSSLKQELTDLLN